MKLILVLVSKYVCLTLIGNQKAYEKEIFIKLRDTFEGITDGNVYGKGTPIDNHPIPKMTPKS